MHRETGFFVVERPIGYALTAAGEGVALAVQARNERELERAAAPLGRSPAVLPSQKQAAASEPTASPKPACTAPAECECRECKAERCARCRLLLQELSAAVHAFSAENGPFMRAYAHLSYQQVDDGKKRLEALGKTVREAQRRFREHTVDAH
jgi:hypothetical protein